MAGAMWRLVVVLVGVVVIAPAARSRPHPASSSSSSSSSSSDAREFLIVEELPANSFVCNLITQLGFDSRYDPPVVDRLRFSFLTTPTVFHRNYFAIDERSGVIHTTERIDREQLCPGGVIVVDRRAQWSDCLLYTSPSPRDRQKSRMPSSA